MLEEYEAVRNDIRHTRIIEQNYHEAIKKSMKYLKTLNSLKNKNVKSDRWFCLHDIGLCNKKLGNFNEAIRFELLAINNTAGDFDYRQTSSKWLIAECYYLTGNKVGALKLYSECERFYKEIEDVRLRICIIWNRAKIYQSIKGMLKLLGIYEESYLKTIVQTYGDMEYDDILTEMYTDLINCYIKLDRRQEAFKLLCMLRDKNLRKRLGEKLNVA